MKIDNAHPPLAENRNDAVALFMHRYGSTLPLQPPAGQDSPGQLDKKCLSLIRREFSLHQQKIAAQKVLNAARRAAVFLILISLILFAVPRQSTAAPDTDPAMPDIPKTPVWSFHLNYDKSANYRIPVYSSDPLKGLLPEDFKVAEIYGDTYPALDVLYAAPGERYIHVSCTPFGGRSTYSLENASTITPFLIDGELAVVLEYKNSTTLFWFNHVIGCQLKLYSKNIPKTELAAIAIAFNKIMTDQSIERTDP